MSESDPKPAVERWRAIDWRKSSAGFRLPVDVIAASDYDALEAERDALRARVAELEADYQSLIKRHAFLQELDNAARARIAELEARGVDHAEIGYAIAARMKAEAENTELRARVAELEDAADIVAVAELLKRAEQRASEEAK